MSNWKNLEKKVRDLLLDDDAVLTPGSGNVKKEEDVVTCNLLCQCKYTDKKNVSILEKDINRLVKSAEQLEKVPIFINSTHKRFVVSLLDDTAEKILKYVVLLARIDKLNNDIIMCKDTKTLLRIKNIANKLNSQYKLISNNIKQNITDINNKLDIKINNLTQYDLFEGKNNE